MNHSIFDCKNVLISFFFCPAQRVQLSCEVELIEQALHDIECRISTNGKAEVIGKQQDLLKSIETIFERSMTNFVPTPVSYDLPR